MYKLLLLLLAVAYALACDKYPNGTASAVHFYTCASGQLTITALKFTDTDGNENYPVNVAKNIVMHMTMSNSGGSIAKVKADVAVAKWSDGGFLGCKWLNYPTFGIANNQDACAMGGRCPVPSGSSTMTINLDLSKYGPVVGLLSPRQSYQIAISFKDESGSALGCLAVQSQITKMDAYL